MYHTTVILFILTALQLAAVGSPTCPVRHVFSGPWAWCTGDKCAVCIYDTNDVSRVPVVAIVWDPNVSHCV